MSDCTTTPAPLNLDCGHPAAIVGHGVSTGYAVDTYDRDSTPGIVWHVFSERIEQ